MRTAKDLIRKPRRIEKIVGEKDRSKNSKTEHQKDLLPKSDNNNVRGKR